MSNTGLLVIGPQLFKMKFLTFLYLNHNGLTFVPPEICELRSLTLVDLSHNKLRSLPPEMGLLRQLKELLLFQNQLSRLPYELGSLFQMQTLGLHGNPLSEPWLTYSREGTEAVMSNLLDNIPISQPPPERQWKNAASADERLKRTKKTATPFSCFCFNVLCDKYATRQAYAYCPSWALDWEYRKGQILKEITNQDSDILLLQEVEMQEFYSFFQIELRKLGYEGIYNAKSRAQNMGDHDRKSVDGCATFYRTEKFEMKKQFLVEFNSKSTSMSGGAKDVLNRVMPKDNIAIGMMLEVVGSKEKQEVFVWNAHLTWDPEFCDVKVVQSMILLHEVHRNLKESGKKGAKPCVIIGGDFNSELDSGVYEYMDKGKIAKDHKDFKGYDFSAIFDKVGLSHPLKLRSCYTGEMPYTNYTHDFTGTIDYIFYTQDTIIPTGVLGPVDPVFLEECDGCPNPHFPSDHFCIAAELKLLSD